MDNSINTTQEIIGKKKNNKSGIIRTLMKITLAATLTATTPQFTNATESTRPQTEQVEQDTIPDHITNTEKLIGKYYPNYAEYFEPIFSILKGMSQNAKNTINKKIQENFEVFEEELATERDKCTTTLIAIDELLGERTFIKGEKQIDSEDGIELLKGISDEITADIKIQFSKELKESRDKLASEKDRLASEKDRLASEKDRLTSEKDRLASEKDRLASEKDRLASEKDRLTKAQEKLLKIKKIKEDIIKSTTPEGILKSIEELFQITEINEIKNDQAIKEIIEYYISIGKKINWNPNPLGKKFIEEYNKL